LQGAINDVLTLDPGAGLPQLQDNQELHHYDQSLDYIISDQTVGNFIEDDNLPNAVRFWKALTSDSKHIAVFAYITFGGRGR
jgi:hypothetical protein